MIRKLNSLYDWMQHQLFFVQGTVVIKPKYFCYNRWDYNYCMEKTKRNKKTKQKKKHVQAVFMIAFPLPFFTIDDVRLRQTPDL